MSGWFEKAAIECLFKLSWQTGRQNMMLMHRRYKLLLLMQHTKLSNYSNNLHHPLQKYKHRRTKLRLQSVGKTSKKTTCPNEWYLCVWYMDPPEQQQQKKDPCSRFLWVIGDGINQKCKEVIRENALNRSYSVDDEPFLWLQGFATKIES